MNGDEIVAPWVGDDSLGMGSGRLLLGNNPHPLPYHIVGQKIEHPNGDVLLRCKVWPDDTKTKEPLWSDPAHTCQVLYTDPDGTLGAYPTGAAPAGVMGAHFSGAEGHFGPITITSFDGQVT